MKTVPFLQELVEARIFKDGSSVRDKSAEELAEIVFLMFLLLEITRFEDRGSAISYANNIFKWYEFKSMKTSGNDMYNLLAVLSNQDLYDQFIDSNHSISIPEFQLKRYLRDMINKTNQHTQDRQFIRKLADYLKVDKYKNERRIVGDWEISSKAEKHGVITVLRREFAARCPMADIWTSFRSYLKE